MTSGYRVGQVIGIIILPVVLPFLLVQSLIRWVKARQPQETRLLRHGWWKRWIKILFRIDPLVGMYMVHQGSLAVVLDRIENKPEPAYLVHWFCGTPQGEHAPIEHNAVRPLLSSPDRGLFFYSRKEAERYRNLWERTALAPATRESASHQVYGPN